MPKKRKTNLTLIVIVLVIAIFIGGLIAYKPAPRVEVPKVVSDLSTEGFVKIENVSAAVAEGRGVVSLTGNCYRVIAGTDAVQARSIQNALAGIVAEGGRPNTHELIKDAFENLGIKVLMVKIIDVKESNFIGRLLLQQGDTILSLDSRPSDGIAIAVRVNATIYFKEDLMKQYGEKIC